MINIELHNKIMKKAKSTILHKSLILGFLAILFFPSCDIINNDEVIPSYIRIDTFLLNTTPYSQGPNNHTITDVWISVNGDFIGLFELPAEFPVLQTGDANIIIFAGIKKNGIAASRVKYPFYNFFSMDTVLHSNQILTIVPTISYSDETIFTWYENFEDPGTSIDTTMNSTVDIIDTTANGSQVAKIKLQGNNMDFEAVSINSFEFPGPSTSLYYEMDYKCDHQFVMGLNIYNSGELTKQPVMLINPIDHWNKIYIDLTYLSTINYTADYYKVYFVVIRTDTTSSAEVLLDNIKLLNY